MAASSPHSLMTFSASPRPTGLATGNDLVELARKRVLVGGALRDPHEHLAAPAHKAIQVHPISAHAEQRHGRTLHLQQRIGGKRGRDGIQLAAHTSDQLFGGKLLHHHGHRRGARRWRGEWRRHRHGIRCHVEGVGETRENLREGLLDPAHPNPFDEKG